MSHIHYCTYSNAGTQIILHLSKDKDSLQLVILFLSSLLNGGEDTNHKCQLHFDHSFSNIPQGASSEASGSSNLNAAIGTINASSVKCSVTGNGYWQDSGSGTESQILTAVESNVHWEMISASALHSLLPFILFS